MIGAGHAGDGAAPRLLGNRARMTPRPYGLEPVEMAPALTVGTLVPRQLYLPVLLPHSEMLPKL